MKRKQLLNFHKKLTQGTMSQWQWGVRGAWFLLVITTTIVHKRMIFLGAPMDQDPDSSGLLLLSSTPRVIQGNTNSLLDSFRNSVEFLKKLIILSQRYVWGFLSSLLFQDPRRLLFLLGFSINLIVYWAWSSNYRSITELPLPMFKNKLFSWDSVWIAYATLKCTE